ncbi:MAG: hypothetical protein BWY96_01903 [Spirochaetes bacterium ADurb.BinA120]|nr:MAG: hypothetical protein BWY96_01903 [Spirochaetes bacterium ADurb.BinA120]
MVHKPSSLQIEPGAYFPLQTANFALELLTRRALEHSSAKARAIEPLL